MPHSRTALDPLSGRLAAAWYVIQPGRPAIYTTRCFYVQSALLAFICAALEWADNFSTGRPDLWSCAGLVDSGEDRLCNRDEHGLRLLIPPYDSIFVDWWGRCRPILTPTCYARFRSRARPDRRLRRSSGRLPVAGSLAHLC